MRVRLFDSEILDKMNILNATITNSVNDTAAHNRQSCQGQTGLIDSKRQNT
jgi:hypothetical protein